MPHTEPVSPRTGALHSRTRHSEPRHGVCLYCAVGCSLLYHIRGNELLAVEGDPASPINRGRLCPKGAGAHQLVRNPHRVTHVKYRAPFAETWEERPLDWALDTIAARVKATRDQTFTERNPEGLTVNVCRGVASLGGSACDNEENYLLKKLLTGGLGVLAIENQARL